MNTILKVRKMSKIAAMGYNLIVVMIRYKTKQPVLDVNFVRAHNE